MSGKLRALILMVVAGWFTLAASAQSPRQTTASQRARGDGGPAIRADVHPDALALDANGNLYVAEREEGSVRRIGTDGIITTVAGAPNPDQRFGGDGGPATRALLCFITAIAVDSAGNLYIGDFEHNEDGEAIASRLRRVGRDGVISTVAGGKWGYSGDRGPAAAAQFGAIDGIALANGNIYLADGPNHRVRRINRSGIVLTVTGDGRGSINSNDDSWVEPGPSAIAVDRKGFLLILEGNGLRVLDDRAKLTPLAGVTMRGGFGGDGGPADRASMSRPHGIAVDAAGAIYIGDTDNRRVRKIAPDGTISTVAGSGAEGNSGDGGQATRATFRFISGLAVDGRGNLYIADLDNRRVRMVAPNGVITTVAGNRRPTPLPRP
jgi:sugar lactone lactonase YvrE